MKLPYTNPDQLTRRLLSNYLMFGLLSIVSLAVSMLIIMKASQAPSHGLGLLARLAESAKQLTEDLAENHGDEQQAIIEQLAQDTELQFCGVLNFDGVYSAHSNPELTGRKGVVRLAADSIPGVVERVSYLREDQQGPKEYWLPLRVEDKVFGVLQAQDSARCLQSSYETGRSAFCHGRVGSCHFAASGQPAAAGSCANQCIH